MGKRKFRSDHRLGDTVVFAVYEPTLDNFVTGEVTAVTFRKDKVTYDLELDVGGEPLINVDSCFVHRIH